MGRPFHKFFNLGERERAETLDWSAPHIVLDKLDGSTVPPVMLEGALVFMTRMGATTQAERAEARADGGIAALSRFLLAAGSRQSSTSLRPTNAWWSPIPRRCAHCSRLA
ncbi:RNA ligase [Methylobacterium sp. R2-1]|uniref:RNA ligase n=1 Tax=Methylobacterium sp. R2-1 TaxID=2587064 RepID=UPI0039181B40